MGEGRRPPDETSKSNPAGQPERPPRDGFLAERQIQGALQRGLFENLPGKGQPLRIDPRQNTPEGIAASLLKEANVVPEWVDLARALDNDGERRRQDLESARTASEHQRAAALAALAEETGPAPPTSRRRWPWSAHDPTDAASHRERAAAVVRRLLSEGEEERRRLFDQYFRRASEERRRTRRFNQVVPFANRQRGLLDLDEAAREFVAAWPALALRSGEGEWSLVAQAVEPTRPQLEPTPEDQEAARARRDPARLMALRGLTRNRRTPPNG